MEAGHRARACVSAMVYGSKEADTMPRAKPTETKRIQDMTEAEILAELARRSAPATAPAATSDKVTPTGLVLEDDAPRPSRSAAITGISVWGVEFDSIPLGKRARLFDGRCDASKHSDTRSKYIGQPFTVYALGRCGDFEAARQHKTCRDKGAPCGGHVFEVRMPDGHGGCTSCARRIRKELEGTKM